MVVKIKSCEVCKVTFKTLNVNKKYCSKKCYNYIQNINKKIRRANNPENFRLQDKKCYEKRIGYSTNEKRVCKYCNKEYVSNRISDISCGSEKCRTQHRLIRQRKQKKEQYKNNKKLFSIRRKINYLKDREKIIKKVKEYSIKNKDKISKTKKTYRENNIDIINSYMKDYYNENSKEIIYKNKIYYENNKDEALERVKKYYKKNRIRILDRVKEYRKNNREKINTYTRKKNIEDINFRLAKILRQRLRNALKNNRYKKYSAIDLVGCSLEHLKKHIEKQFKDNMSWDNYGYYGWHIDHIIPCASYNLEDIEQQNKCFHFTNLQPLWLKENTSKGKKIYDN